MTNDDLTELIRDAVLSGRSDEYVLALAADVAGDGETREQVVIEALESPPGRRSDREETLALNRSLIRWYRRAADLDQPWAMWRGGGRWGLSGSNGSLPQEHALTESEAVSSEEAIGWLHRAADHGIRPAAMSAAEASPDDPRAIDWLRLAYGDGLPTEDIDRNRLLDAAFMLASCLSESGDPEAGQWFRKSVECAPWENQIEFRTSSWEEAVAGYALWAHSNQNPSLCAAWCWRLVENAANLGPVA
ncbi:hypothetical protein [Ruania rhizosphaerae]|uniref:hypothetical protein n=1 Tax=Ruania rhizosphaerae TaxID=1840413 RepID=UPI00135C3F28|nr:hypothetical protein [Ruania rhizosphaerae]